MKILLSVVVMFILAIPVEAKVFSGKRLGKVREKVGHVMPKVKAVRGKVGRKVKAKKSHCGCGATCPKACGCGCK